MKLDRSCLLDCLGQSLLYIIVHQIFLHIVEACQPSYALDVLPIADFLHGPVHLADHLRVSLILDGGHVPLLILLLLYRVDSLLLLFPGLLLHVREMPRLHLEALDKVLGPVVAADAAAVFGVVLGAIVQVVVCVLHSCIYWRHAFIHGLNLLLMRILILNYGIACWVYFDELLLLAWRRHLLVARGAHRRHRRQLLTLHGAPAVASVE